MKIFESTKKIGDRPAKQDEPYYEYIANSERPITILVLNTLEQWFTTYRSVINDNEKIEDLRARLQSNDNIQFLGAFTELYVFILLKNFGYEITAEKELQNGKKPDFLVKMLDGKEFYVEVTTFSGGKFNKDRQEAINLIVGKINKKIKSLKYAVNLKWHGNPLENDVNPKVLSDIQKWIDDPKVSFTREFDNWTLTLESLDIPEQKHDSDNGIVAFFANSKIQCFSSKDFQPDEITENAGDFLTDIKKSLTDKAKKYGELEKPYIIVLNLLNNEIQESIVEDAILSETIKNKIRISQSFFNKQTNINGVLVSFNLDPFNMMDGAIPRKESRYFINPNAIKAFDHIDFRKLFSKEIFKENTHRLDRTKILTHLYLPQEKWNKALKDENPAHYEVLRYVKGFLESPLNQQFDAIEQYIANHDIDNFIATLAKRCCGIYRDQDKESRQVSEDERNIVLFCSWLCFFAIGCKFKHTQSRNQQINNNQLKNLCDRVGKAFIAICKPSYSYNFLNKLNTHLIKEKIFKDTINMSDLQEFTHNFLYESHFRILNKEKDCKYLGLWRSLGIFDELQILCPESQENLNTLQDQFGVASILEYHQIFYLIYIIVFQQDGYIEYEHLNKHLRSFGIPEEKLSQCKNAIFKILNLISHTNDEIKEIYNNFRNDVFNKSTLLHDDNPFYKKPFYKCEINNKIAFLCPSLYIFNWCTSWLPLMVYEENIRKLANDEQRGHIYVEYVKKFVFHYQSKQNNNQILNVVDIDKKLKAKSKNQPKTADLIIETKEYIFIVECKNSGGIRTPITNAPTKKNGKDVHPLPNRFERIRDSLIQCVETRDNSTTREKLGINATIKPFFSIIVVNETVLAESATFFLAACQGLLAEENNVDFQKECGKFSILSIYHLENLIMSENLENFAKECEKQFKTLEKLDFKNAYETMGMNFIGRLNNSDYDTSFIKELDDKLCKIY